MLPAANMIRTALRRPCARVDSTLPRGYSRCIRLLYERELVMFEKKIEIFKKKDRAAWTEIRDLLKKEGVAGISAGHYLQESVMAGGCGAKLDPRDFGKKGKIDRDIYYIRVRAADADRVREILRRNGITAGIDEDLMTDAALKKRHSYI